MVDLGTLANVAEIVGAVSVVVGLVYAAWEVRRYREEKHRQSGMALWQEIGGSEAWTRAVRRVWRLPDDADPSVIEEDPERSEAANQVATMLNVNGFLIHEGIMPADLAARSQGGSHLVLWRKIRRWVEAAEEQGGSPDTFIWLRWWIRELAEMEPLDLPDRDELHEPLEGASLDR